MNRRVPLITDTYIDMSFGTGALKVTPAHDISDYDLGLKFGLPIVDTLNEDGTLSDAAQVYVGLDRFEARKKVAEKLREEGLILKEEPIHPFGFLPAQSGSSRTKNIYSVVCENETTCSAGSRSGCIRKD